jgi:ADP-ribosylglycohydrolase
MSESMTPVLLDRAIGAILGSAAGDALGAPYEFQPSVPDTAPIVMHAGGGWELGEWTDDTSMAIPILRALAQGRALDDAATLEEVVAAWHGWARTAKDVGIQTRQVLSGLAKATEAEARESARRVHERSGRSAGNGSLMRTGPVALGFLDDGADAALATSARRISDLTHYESDAGDACVIWSLAIRHAIRTGEFEIRGPIDALPEERRARWHELVDVAEGRHPREIPGSNGWVVAALQAAWAAITGADTLPTTLERAVHCGNDTDTVAAIAGALAGAKYGATELPFAWRRHLHGWPFATDSSSATGASARREGDGADKLARLAVLAVRHGQSDGAGWPTADRFPREYPGKVLVRSPHDDGVWLGDLAALDRLPAEVDAVVSLCRVGTHEVPPSVVAHHQAWLIDLPGQNSNLDTVLADTADAIAALRGEGRVVLVHCVEARSRTPIVAAAYATRHVGMAPDQALSDVETVLPQANPQPEFVAALRRIRQNDNS